MDTSQALKENWQKLEEQSNELLTLLSNETWDNAADLAKQRHHLIVRHFNLFPVNDDNAAFYAEKLPMLQKTDTQLRSLAQKTKQDLKGRLQSIDTGKTAIKAYQNTEFSQ